ncbi:MAG: hypothetical protein AMXMBFR58_31460 [Phycisphaerae bacterium]|nr:hypothetical protein [Phycisphaerales bacterium]
MGHVALREVLVDFLGSLVPGIIFTGTVVGVFLWPAYLCIDTLFELWLQDPSKIPSASSESSLPGLIGSVGSTATFWVLVGIFVIAVAYVLGHLFYRQDPKGPDRASFMKLLRIGERRRGEGLDPKALEGWVVHEPRALACEFPYPNLVGYLKKRGAMDLATRIPWDPAKNNLDMRTKNFINALKIRLEFFFPVQYVVIARNEAHVRLMSSCWYMSRVIKRLSSTGLVLSAMVIVLAIYTILRPGVLPLAVATVDQVRILGFSLITSWIGFVAAWYLKGTIERFLHYQRVREVMFVLETALTADPKGKLGVWGPPPDTAD